MVIENPVTQLERIRWQRPFTQRKIGYWLRLVAYFFILLIAAIPAFIYIDDQSVFLLGFMLLILIPAQLILVFRTLMLATEKTILQRQTGMWESLVLTGMSARQIIKGKCDAVVQSMWAEWMLLGAARLGGAYGLALYLHIGDYLNCVYHLPNGFCFQSWPDRTYRPDILEILVALVALLVLSHFELQLVSLIGIASSLLPTKNRTLSWVVAGLLWLGLTGGAILGIGSLSQLQWQIFHQGLDCSQGSYCGLLEAHMNGDFYGESFFWRQRYDNYVHVVQDLHRVVDVLEVSTSALADNGLMLAAQVMRPNPLLYIRYLVGSLISVGIAWVSVRLLNWLMLMIAERLAIAQGALPDQRRSEILHFLKHQIGFG
jgi:hypothetical protein